MTNILDLKAEKNNLYTTFDNLIPRESKEMLLNQRGMTIWLTGLSGSGKTTIAQFLEKKLLENNIITKLLDGDNIRVGINNNLGFSAEDRKENIRRIAEVSKLFVECGIVTINCFISPTIIARENAKNIIGKADFIEVFVNTSLEEFEKRYVKGLYKKARKGLIKDFTGITSPYEPPLNPSITIKTLNRTIENCGQELYKFVYQQIKLN